MVSVLGVLLCGTQILWHFHFEVFVLCEFALKF